MVAGQSKLFRAFKYTVYGLLMLNVWLFFNEEWAASALRFRDGIAFADIIEGFAATIDTAAWVVLLLMFELETYVLEDRHMTRFVAWALQLFRVLCYVFICYAFFGYLSKLIFLMQGTPFASVNDLCALAGQNWAYATDLDQYEMITASTCDTFTSSHQFVRFAGMDALVDADGYREIVRLGWVDVINAGVWLGVVGVLEMDVQLQTRERLHGRIQRISNGAKYIMYSLLFLAAVYWGFKGDFVDFWDAFLWLVAFVFIELNVVQWQQEDELAAKDADAALHGGA
ncbi:MAG: hypothetical protein RIA65_07105 [Woeseia sp.]